MNRASPFSYSCNACGLCCHNKVITLSPYDVLRLARAAGCSTREAIERFTIRRGSILKFNDGGACVALEGVRCGVHRGRPLACRLYPLGIEAVEGDGGESFVRLDPAPGSLGVYGDEGNVDDFLAAQGVAPYLQAIARYAGLISIFRDRILATADFELVEPREFWRRARREALSESNYDANPIIDAMFDADVAGKSYGEADTVERHIQLLTDVIRNESNPERLAAAAIMLAVSLGRSPREVSG